MQSPIEQFNDKELAYLKLIYKGLDKQAVTEELKFSKRKYREMEKAIFEKLSVNNWHNAFRRAFNLQLLDRNDFLSLDIKKEASMVSKKIIKVLQSNEINEKEKELAVYLALLSFHIKVEYSYLFKRNEKESSH